MPCMRSMARGVRTPKIRTWPRWRPCMAYKLIWTHAHAHALVTRVTVTGWRSMRREHAIRRIYTFRLQADRHRVPSYIIRHVPVLDLFPARASFLVSAPDSLPHMPQEQRLKVSRLLCTRHITRNSLSVYYSSIQNENLDRLVSTLQRNRMEISVSIGLRDSRARYTYRSTTGLDFSWNLSNLTNATNSTIDCNPMLDNSSVRDGNIPQVLGISIGAWAVGI